MFARSGRALAAAGALAHEAIEVCEEERPTRRGAAASPASTHRAAPDSARSPGLPRARVRGREIALDLRFVDQPRRGDRAPGVEDSRARPGPSILGPSDLVGSRARVSNTPRGALENRRSLPGVMGETFPRPWAQDFAVDLVSIRSAGTTTVTYSRPRSRPKSACTLRAARSSEPIAESSTSPGMPVS